MKKFIKSLELRWSDLALFIGFICFAIFLIFGQLFMQYQNPNDVALPLGAAIPLFIVMIGSFGVYLYLEVYRSKEQFNIIIPAIIFTLILMNTIAIFVQPSVVSENVLVRINEEQPELVGKYINVLVNVSDTHKFIFIAEMMGVGLMIYIGLFVFPKRIKSITFIKYLGYALYALLFVVIIYGYIAEFNNYVGFFKYLLGIDRSASSLYVYAIKSFVIHRNAYGMMMMLGIVFTFINHAMEKKWFYFLFTGFFFANMIFSLCKTGLIISVLIILIYVYYRLIATYKEHVKRNKISIIVLSSVIGLGVILVGLSFITKGKFLGFIYGLVAGGDSGASTLDTRMMIWDNSYQLLRDGWWLIGRGFGTYNLILMPMNIASHNDHVFPGHSAYITLLSEGGILFLLAYLAFLGYMGVIIYRCFKKNPALTLAISLGVLSFVLYSFIEAIHYLVYVFLFPIMVLYFSSSNTQEIPAKTELNDQKVL